MAISCLSTFRICRCISAVKRSVLQSSCSDDPLVSLYINKGTIPMPELSVRPYQLEPRIDLQPHLEDLEIISLSLGPDTVRSVLAIVPPAQYRERRAGASFARIRPGKPN